MRIPTSPLALALLAVPLWSAAASSAPAPGDLDGDGVVAEADASLLESLWDSQAGDPGFDAAADLNGNGEFDVGDLAILGAATGSSGDPDTTAPTLLVTLNDIPDDMNDLLVAPPDAFLITIEIDAGGGSLIDPESLVVTSDQDVGPFAAGTDLAREFGRSPTRAVWEVPPGYDLARTTHTLSVTLADLAGNEASESFRFAVRDFVFGPPLGNPQTVFVDFSQDRSLGPEVDFIEDLREYGLSSASAPEIESSVLDLVTDTIVSRMNTQYGRGMNGEATADSANVVFTDIEPSGSHSRICVGGRSPSGASFLGAATFDENNVIEASDECATGNQFGVFPQAIEDLWGDDPDYQALFAALDPDLGGTPVGEHPEDADIFGPGFTPATATREQLNRLQPIGSAFDAFVWTVATATSHEVGHMLGLVKDRNPPEGCFGDSLNHNRTPGGQHPSGNFIMNHGGSFSFAEVAGLMPGGPSAFRPTNWAYLRDRLAPNPRVYGLFPPPDLQSVVPNVVTFPPVNAWLTFYGEGFLTDGDAPIIELVREGDRTPELVMNVSVLDSQTVTGSINQLFVVPDVYDVRFENADGQVVVLPAALEVR